MTKLIQIKEMKWRDEEAWYRRGVEPEKALEEFIKNNPKAKEIKIKIMEEEQ